MDLQSSRYRTDPQNKPIQTKDLIPVVNDLEKLSEAMSNNIVEAPFIPDDNPIVAGDTYQEAFEKTQGQINGIGTEITTINGEIAQLQNNEYKITYYEVVSGAGGSLTVPTGATINEGEFGSSGNCILSKINVDNKPTFESPKTAGGVIVTASLDPITGVWVASGVYTDPSVALIYSLKVNALNYPNLDYDFIVESEEIDDKTTFVAPLVKDVSKDEVSIPPATTTDDGYLTSTDWNTFNNKQAALGFTPENVANKSTDVNADQASNTKYPSVKAVYDWVLSTLALFKTTNFLDATSSIQTQLNNRVTIIYSNIIDGSTVTGTTAEVKQTGILIPANTFTVGDTIEIVSKMNATGTNGTKNLFGYFNTSDSLSGATLVFRINSTANTQIQLKGRRDYMIKTTTNTAYLSGATSSVNDYNTFTSAIASTNIDWTIDQYYIPSIQNGSALDSSVLAIVMIYRKRKS